MLISMGRTLQRALVALIDGLDRNSRHSPASDARTDIRNSHMHVTIDVPSAVFSIQNMTSRHSAACLNSQSRCAMTIVHRKGNRDTCAEAQASVEHEYIVCIGVVLVAGHHFLVQTQPRDICQLAHIRNIMSHWGTVGNRMGGA